MHLNRDAQEKQDEKPKEKRARNLYTRTPGFPRPFRPMGIVDPSPRPALHLAWAEKLWAVGPFLQTLSAMMVELWVMLPWHHGHGLPYLVLPFVAAGLLGTARLEPGGLREAIPHLDR
jgi:hypothetical protein